MSPISTADLLQSYRSSGAAAVREHLVAESRRGDLVAVRLAFQQQDIGIVHHAGSTDLARSSVSYDRDLDPPNWASGPFQLGMSYTFEDVVIVHTMTTSVRPLTVSIGDEEVGQLPSGHQRKGILIVPHAATSQLIKAHTDAGTFVGSTVLVGEPAAGHWRPKA